MSLYRRSVELRSLGRAALLGLACIVVLAGVAFRNGALLSLALPLIILMMIEPWLAKRQDLAIEAIWGKLEDVRFMEGDEISLELHLCNRGKGNDLLLFHIAIPEGLRLDQGRRSFPLAIAPGEEVSLTFRLGMPRRGHYIVGPVKIEWRDLFHVYHIEKDLGAAVELWVMPIIQDLRRCDLRPTKVRPFLGNVRSRMLGPGSEFHSLRDYVTGDELRTINWKASARTEGLVVNEHESERSGDVVIVVDARSEVGGRSRPSELIDHEVQAAASLSAFYLRQRDRVGMMVIAGFIDLVEPAFGRKQFYRIVEHLTEIGPGGDRSTISVRLAMQRFFPPRSLMLYITPLDDSSTAQAIKELSRHGYQVVVISPTLSIRGGDPVLELERRVLDLRREDEVLDLRRYCQVIDWNTKEPLSKYLVGVRGWHRRI